MSEVYKELYMTYAAEPVSALLALQAEGRRRESRSKLDLQVPPSLSQPERGHTAPSTPWNQTDQ